MTPTIRRLRCLLVLGLPFAAPPAEADSAACRPVMMSMVRLTGTPSHQFMNQVLPGIAPRQSEMATTGKTMSVLAPGGHRITMPYDAQQKVAEMKRKFAESSAAGKESCTRVRSEAVGGEPTTVYVMHDDTKAGMVDVQVWISDARGLPLRQVVEIPELKSHTDVRFDYANVQAPPAH